MQVTPRVYLFLPIIRRVSAKHRATSCTCQPDFNPTTNTENHLFQDSFTHVAVCDANRDVLSPPLHTSVSIPPHLSNVQIQSNDAACTNMAKNPTNEPVSIQLASSLSDQPNQLRHFIDVGPCYHLVRDKIWNQQTVSVFCDKSPVPDDQVIFE